MGSTRLWESVHRVEVSPLSSSLTFEMWTNRRVRGLCVGGANLMGADLYKNLQQYWINHLKEVRAVRPFSPLPPSKRDSMLMIGSVWELDMYRQQKIWVMKLYWGITWKNGIDTRMVLLTFIVCSLIWIDTGSNVRRMKEGKTFTSFTSYVSFPSLSLSRFWRQELIGMVRG